MTATKTMDDLVAPNQYAVGDIVQLKSGGPRMTVTIGLIESSHGGISITDKHNDVVRMRGYPITFCSWFDKHDVHHHYGFATATLMRLDTEEVLDTLSGEALTMTGTIGEWTNSSMGRCEDCNTARYDLYAGRCRWGCS